jgi:pSer/pThr/pTyr-binding forkhead associated (FHA) protein
MQNLSTSQTTGLSLELFHVQTNTSFELPPNLAVIRIGKPNDQILPDIDVSNLPDTDIVSRLHAEIQVEESTYYIVDIGSSNGTFVNNAKLEPETRYPLNLGDIINLGQEEKVTFIFQLKQNHLSSDNAAITNRATVIQPEIIGKTRQVQVDRTSKLIGILAMVGGVAFLAANTQIGIFLRIPSVLLLLAGIVLLIWRREYRLFGWFLIGLGITIMFFTGNVFASVNLLAILVTFILFIGGYQLYSTGKILNYSLHSLKRLGKK